MLQDNNNSANKDFTEWSLLFWMYIFLTVLWYTYTKHMQ